MKYRKMIYGKLIICALLFGFSMSNAFAQYMPVVFDRTYGENVEFQNVCPASSGEVVMVGTTNGKTTVAWVKRNGEVMFSRTLTTGFISVSDVKYQERDNRVMILGQSNGQTKGKNPKPVGRALLLDNRGESVSDVYVGDGGSELLCGRIMPDGTLFVGGYETKSGGVKSGLVAKLTSAGSIVYKYVASESGPCVSFDVLGSSKEYIHAAFTSDEGSVASVTGIDSNGKAFFITTMPEEDFEISKMVTASDGYIFLVGTDNSVAGRVLKLRPEGDVIFNKIIVPASESALFDQLYISNSGNLLVGGNGGNKAYYSLLRNDGTDLQKYITAGAITGMGMNSLTGESVVVISDSERGRGSIVGLTKEGLQTFQKATDGNFDYVVINPSGILLASASTGRISMMSATGEVAFDRYAVEESRESFEQIHFTKSGDILLKAQPNRLIKLGHGLYVSDVKINKPVNGYTTALFTITLTGYSMNEQGVPTPVTVGFSTREGTATESNNYIPVKGNLSFVPSNDGGNKYMIKQDVEVPIKANDLFEGRKLFELCLNNVNQSYLVKPTGIATIEDQEAVVKFVASTDGLEGERDVVYELGIFKTNGDPLVNASGSDVFVDGKYGKGTADGLDYDMGIAPRVIIANRARTGQLKVKTLVDTRYELPKTVVVDFNRINAISDANIAFEGAMLSCSGSILDQPATLAITSLGDHGRMNSVVSGFFRVALQRKSDGALLTNATGGDIEVSCSLSPETTGTEGKDFVFTNWHDLRIWGDGNRSTVNLNGIVLFDKDKTGSKQLAVGVDGLKTPAYAPEITILPEARTAKFMITD